MGDYNGIHSSAIRKIMGKANDDNFSLISSDRRGKNMLKKQNVVSCDKNNK